MIEPGKVVSDRYEVIRRIGEGGMGEVYEARHVEIGKRVAIKFLSMDFADDEQTLLRFHQEAKIAGNLGQENICEVLDYGKTQDGQPFIVMEYLEGEDLASLIRRKGTLGVTRALGILHQVLGGLEEAHENGIIHRDLKPENVFLARKKHGVVVKLLDFGISKMMEPGGERLSLTKTGAMVGTPFYMSPEHVRGLKDVDHRTDLYSCGVILYQMLTGKRPYEGTSFNEIMFKIVEEPFPIPEESDIPMPILELIMKAMAREPGDRPQSAEEFKKEVALLAGTGLGDTIPMTTVPTGQRADLERGKWRRISVFVLTPLIAILLVAGVALWVMRSMSKEVDEGSVNLFPVPAQGKWGFVDESGIIAIHPLYDNVGDFSEGYVKVLVGEKWGYASGAGMTVVQPQFQEARDFHQGLAAVRLDDKWGFVDRRGEVAIAAIFDEAGDFSEELASVRSGEKWGYVDKRGKVVIQPQFAAAGRFRGSLAPAASHEGWGYIGKDGGFVSSPKYGFASEFHEGLARVKTCKGESTDFCKWGYVDENGKIAIGPKFDWAHDFSESLALVMAEGSWGYIGPSGHFDIQPRFARADSFESGLARVMSGGRWGFIDRTGNWAIEPRFYLVGDFDGPLAGATYVTRLPSDENATIETDSGYIDTSGKFVWNPPGKDLASEVPPGNRQIWNFDFLTGKIRVIGSFDPTTYELKFREEEGMFTTVPLELPHPLELGSIRTVYPAENYTLILTANYLVLTLGWAAIVSGETSLVKTRLEGKDLISNASAIPLTEDARGSNLLGWALGMNRVYLLTSSGKLKYKDLVDLYSGLREFIMPEPPSEHATMHYRDGWVLVFEPGTHYLAIDDESEAIEPVKKELGFEASEPPEVEDGPETLVVKFGDRTLELEPDDIASWRQPPDEDPLAGI